MTNAGDVFGAGTEFHGHHGLGDQLAGLRTHDVHAQDFVGGRISQHFHHAGRVAQSTGTAIGQERERTRLVGHAIGFELLLSTAHPSDFGAGVDDPRDGVEVDVTVLACDALGHGNTLFFGFVRQHRATHHVAHRPDTG